MFTAWLGVCCDLYNAALQERREAWRVARKRIGFFDQTHGLAEARDADLELAAVPSRIQKSALRRVSVAFEAFFRRCKIGENPGYPRFRPRRRYDSFSFPFVRVDDNRVYIPKLGSVRFHRYRPLGGSPVHVTIGREPTGKWFVSFICDLGAAPIKVSVRSAAGIDLGLTAFATLSDGVTVPNPHWRRSGAPILRRRYQTLSRRDPGSASRERARVAVARAHEHITNQRRDFGRKLAKQLFDRYDLIAHEDLNIRGMVRGHFGKSISDAAWGVFLRCLASKAESAGKHVIAVDPRGTSQRCSGCGAEVRKDLSQRTHACPRCGIVLDRDHNAALNVLALGMSAVEAGTPVVETEGQEAPAACTFTHGN